MASGCQGTITPHPGFNAETDCQALNKAMVGLGTDEKALISIICFRSNAQRQELKTKYKSMYGRDLVDHLKSELSGNFENVLVGLMYSEPDYNAYSIKKAVRGAGTDEAALVEVLCSASNEEMEAMKESYKKLYKKSMEDAVRTDVSGDFKRLLVSLITAKRDDDGPVDQAKAAADAQDLYKAGEGKWGTDESMFNVILCTRSYSHLRAVFDQYERISKKSMEGAIRSEMSGDLEDGYLALVKCVRSRPKYFAERLYKSMKGLGTDDDTLVRVMVSRSEKDLVQIKAVFPTLYPGKTDSLEKFIKGDTSGDYERALLAICR